MLGCLRIITLPNQDEVFAVEYNYALDAPELGVFDRLSIRQITAEKDQSFLSETHVTFQAAVGRTPSKKIEAIEKLIALYGGDSDGEEDLFAHEKSILEINEYWDGREWEFNMDHGLWDRDNDEEINTYSVHIFNGQDNLDTYKTVLTLTIEDYDSLVQLYT